MKEASVLLILFVFMLCYSSVYGKEKSSEDNNGSYEKSKDARNSSIISIIDPSVCENNAEGYIYFQIGDEVFRYTQDSSVRISMIDGESVLRKERALHPKGVPEGCRENPYVGVFLRYFYKNTDDPYKKLNVNNFGLYKFDSNYFPGVEIGQSLDVRSYLKFKNKNCEKIKTYNTEKCVFPNERDPSLWGRAYKAKWNYNHPFIFICKEYVANVECSSTYRLYSSVLFKISFLLDENKNFNEFDFIKFNEYLFNEFQLMRVTHRN